MQHTLTLEKPFFRAIPRDGILTILACLIIGLSGQIMIPLWFTPVPIALRNAVVLLMAALLGSRRGTAATFAFLLQGALGVPVFFNGAAGIQPFFGPLGGYLIGYLIASYAVGYLVERGKSPFVALVAGNLIIYFCGASHLVAFVGGIRQALLLGVAPFLIGDLFKMLVSLKILQYLSGHKPFANRDGRGLFRTFR